MAKKTIQWSLFFLFILCSHLTQASLNSVTGEIKILNKDGTEEKYLSSVIVFLDRSGEPLSLPVSNKEIVISQRGRRFRPSVLAVTIGTTVTFPNDDRVMHNVFSKSKARPFDLGNYKKGEKRSVTFDTAGHVKVYCNIHAKMELDVKVLKTPYFVTTKKDGRFSIQDIPDGDYTLRVWHELSEEVMQPISLAGGEMQKFTFEIQKTRTRARHKNKYGKPYRNKY